MKKITIKLSSMLVITIFMVMAYGSSESESSEIIDLSKYSHDDMTEVLSKKELNDYEDFGILRYDINLRINNNNTFQYSIIEKTTESVGSTKASGSIQYIGDVKKVDVPYVGFQYEQLIKFSGKTNDGENFELEGKLCQFSKSQGLESKWSFVYENYSRSNNIELNTDNYRLPVADIYP